MTHRAKKIALSVLTSILALQFGLGQGLARPGDVFTAGAPVAAPATNPHTKVRDGEYGVSGRTGAAQYRFPIVVPPGRNGLQPELNLSYSSQNPLRGGLAAGWSMDLPAIRVDVSHGRAQGVHYASDLAGNQRLVQVDEPDVWVGAVAYRAEHDSTFARYEHVNANGGPGYWRVRKADGLVYYFGESERQARDEPIEGSDAVGGRWFLSRIADPFGNEVVFEYAPVLGYARNGELGPLPVDRRLERIGYNFVQGIGYTTWIRFEYAPPNFCPNSHIPIGAKFDYRFGFRVYEGASRLTRIATQVWDATDGRWDVRRAVDLAYDTRELVCDASRPHAPLRLLTSITETAWDAQGRETRRPAVTFGYGPLEHNFSETLIHDRDNAGQGHRKISERAFADLPTTETMLQDVDGDGRPDLLRASGTDAPGGTCTFEWERNLGEGAFGEPVTADLPTFPWGASNSFGDESCSLSGQFTRRATTDTNECPEAVYASYHFMDLLDGDGIDELVVALDGVHKMYDAHEDSALDDESLYGVAPESLCPSNGLPCLFGDSHPWICQVSGSTPIVFAAAADSEGGGGESDNSDCQTDDGEAGDPETTNNDDGDPENSDECPDDDPPPNHWEWAGPPLYLPGWQGDGEDAETQVTTGQCKWSSETTCGHFVWRAYRRDPETGSYADPVVVLSPIPLESQFATSALGGTPASSWHGFADMDGDGCTDAVWQQPALLDPEWSGNYQVFFGDCAGGFADVTVWPTPQWEDDPEKDSRARVSLRQTGYLTERRTNDEYHRSNETITSLTDVNGDGLPDLVISPAEVGAAEFGSRVPLHVYYNHGAGFETEATRLSHTVETLEAEHTVLFKEDGYGWMHWGYGRATRAKVDLDGDGLWDLIDLPAPEEGQYNPWAGLDSAQPHTNLGDWLMPTDGTTIGSWAPGLARITVSDTDGWEVISDFRDFDGDGVADLYALDATPECLFDQDPLFTGEQDGWWESCGDGRVMRDAREGGQAMRLLHQVDNGRGGTIRFRYAPASDESVVQSDAEDDRRTPRPLWVVASMDVDPGVGPVATTSYLYRRPVYNADRHGRYGFRGFEEVETEAPPASNGERLITVERFAYDVDPTGRPVADLQRNAEGRVLQVSATDWWALSLFDGAVTTYHPMQERTWTCADGNNDSEAACRAGGALKREVFGYRPVYAFSPLDLRPPRVNDDVQEIAAFPAQIVSPSDPPADSAEPTSCYPDEGPPGDNIRIAVDLGEQRVAPPGAEPRRDTDAVCEQVEDNATGTAVMWVECGKRLTGSPGAVQRDDRYERMRYGLWHGAVRYRLLKTEETRYIVLGDGALELLGREQTQYDDDALGLPLETRRWLDPDTVAVTKRTFDTETGNLESVTRPRQVDDGGDPTVYTYGPYGIHVASTTNPLGHVTFTEHDAATGLATLRRGPMRAGDAGPHERTEYDGFGRVLARFRAVDGGDGSYVEELFERREYGDIEPYTSGGPVWIRSEALLEYGGGRVRAERTELDGIDRQIRSVAYTDVGEAERLYGYDPAGNLVSIVAPDPSDPGSMLEYTYEHDALGRITRSVPPIGAVTTTSYSGLSTYIEQQTMDGSQPLRRRIDKDVYDRLVRVVEYTADDEAVTRYTYDGNDNVDYILDADYFETRIEHDLAGRRRSVTRAGRSWRYEYDKHDNLTHIIAPHPGTMEMDSLYTTTIHHDALDRVSSHLPARRELTPDQLARYGLGMTVYVYDEQERGSSVGRLTTIKRPFGATEYRYSAEGWVTEERTAFSVAPFGDTLSNVQVVSTEYNALGLPTHVIHADGTTTTHQYDLGGRPLGVHAETVSGPIELATITRGLLGEPRQRTSFGQTHSFRYDALGRVVDHDLAVPGGVVAGEEILYNEAGNVRMLRNLAADIGLTFSYDAQHQLLSAESDNGYWYDGAFAYTPAGRPRAARVFSGPAGAGALQRDVSYIYDESMSADGDDPTAVQALQSTDSGNYIAEFDYDASGNLVNRSVQGRAWTFVYDGDNQLREAIGPDGQSEVYFYHSAGQRMLAVRADGGARLWLGDSELTYEGNALQRSAVYVKAGDIPVARIVDGAAQQPELLYHGVLRSLLASIDPSDQYQARYAYGPYGELLWSDGIGAEMHDRLFNGKTFDGVTELSYYGYRYYDRVTLTWTQFDPLYRFAPDMAYDEPRRAALYSFSLNNPVRYVDPDGRDPQSDENSPQEEDDATVVDRSIFAEIVDEVGVDCSVMSCSPKDLERTRKAIYRRGEEIRELRKLYNLQVDTIVFAHEKWRKAESIEIGGEILDPLAAILLGGVVATVGLVACPETAGATCGGAFVAADAAIGAAATIGETKPLDPERVMTNMRDGATLVLNRLGRVSLLEDITGVSGLRPDRNDTFQVSRYLK